MDKKDGYPVGSPYTYVPCYFIHVYRRRKHKGLTCKGTEQQYVTVSLEICRSDAMISGRGQCSIGNTAMWIPCIRSVACFCT